MILQQGAAPRTWRLRAWLLKQLLPYPKRLGMLFALLRGYQGSGLQRLLRASRVLRILPGSLTEAEGMLPALPSSRFEMIRGKAARHGHTKRVALLTGCVMPHLYPRTHEATVRVLERHGVDVVDVPEQRCCGALSVHAGDRVTGRELARRNIDAFLDSGVDAIIVNSAGCGATLTDYGELLEQDQAYADKARRFSELVVDVNQFVAELGAQPPQASLNVRVTYQDSCHLVHGQKVRNAPRQLLESIPGLELVEMNTPDRCCGSAGIYSLAQQEMSMSLLDEKMRDVAATTAPIIATANPGCMMQLEAGLRRHDLEGRVVHVIELLDEAYQAEGDAN
jgi:Fe-S oxidoreductase